MEMAKRSALVVGIDAYDGKFAPPLRFCVRDAREVAEALRLPEFGFEVRTLMNEQATTEAILSNVVDLVETEPQLIAVYFAGHGASTRLGHFLIAYDASPYAEGVELS